MKYLLNMLFFISHSSCLFAAPFLTATSPGDFQWPTLSPVVLDEIALTAEKVLFDRTHFVIESTFRFSPFEQPLKNFDSQVTAHWSQSAILQVHYPQASQLALSLGIGYSIDRNIYSLDYGQHTWETIEPAFVFPLSLSFDRSFYDYNFHTVMQLQLEVSPDYYCRTHSFAHRILSENFDDRSLGILLFSRHKTFFYHPLDNHSAFVLHHVGFTIEHTSY